jgi:hypothetical protein
MTLDGVRAAAAAPSDVEERAADVIKVNTVDKSDSFHDVMTRGMLGRRMKQGEKMRGTHRCSGRCPSWAGNTKGEKRRKKSLPSHSRPTRSELLHNSLIKHLVRGIHAYFLFTRCIADSLA